MHSVASASVQVRLFYITEISRHQITYPLALYKTAVYNKLCERHPMMCFAAHLSWCSCCPSSVKTCICSNKKIDNAILSGWFSDSTNSVRCDAAHVYMQAAWCMSTVMSYGSQACCCSETIFDELFRRDLIFKCD